MAVCEVTQFLIATHLYRISLVYKISFLFTSVHYILHMFVVVGYDYCLIHKQTNKALLQTYNTVTDYVSRDYRRE